MKVEDPVHRISERKFDLEERLVNFACLCLDICDLLPHTKVGQILEYQLTKSATAAALNYGEAQAAESRADFLHKIKIVLKEIRETGVNLKIIKKKPVIANPILDVAINESDELRAIFIKSAETVFHKINQPVKLKKQKSNSENTRIIPPLSPS